MSYAFFTYLFILLILIIETVLKFTDIDNAKFQAGKSEYELMLQKTELPDYGRCWKNTVISLNKECRHINAELQGQLALAYLNCFLEMQGLEVYDCSNSPKLSECRHKLSESDRSSLATFFTHTQNICYFLEAQVWHDQTEQTIGRLASSSHDIATQLEESSELQNELIKQQKETLQNQEEMSETLSSSAKDVHNMFGEFKNITHEQRHMINDLFEKVMHLQSLVLTEFSRVYSVVYFVIMVLVSYLLTSTPRTAAARFWLFGLAIINMVLERCVVSRLVAYMDGPGVTESTREEYLYVYQWTCRKISTCLALAVLTGTAYSYQDLNVVNNKLLMDIQNHTQELRNVLLGNASNERSDNSNRLYDGMNSSGDSTINVTQTSMADTTVISNEDEDGDSDISSKSSTDFSEETDKTYVPSSLSTVDSYSTCYSFESRQTTLTDELGDLRESTPLKQLAQQIDAWAKTGSYSPTSSLYSMESRIADTTPNRTTRSRSTTPQSGNTKGNLVTSKYFLRKRTPQKENSLVQFETPKNFAKTVKALEKYTRKNRLQS